VIQFRIAQHEWHSHYEENMTTSSEVISGSRYSDVTAGKSGGATYTPEILADFVAEQVVKAAENLPIDRPLRIRDPAIGHGGC